MKLEEAEIEHLRGFFSLCVDLLCVLHPDFRFSVTNPSFRETLGVGPDELEGKTFLDVILEDDRPRVRTALSRLQADHPRVQLLGRCLTKDGKVRPVEWRAQRDPDNGLFYLLGVDVTEREEMQEALRESDHKFLTLFDNAAQGIVAIDASGTITSANAMAGKLFGFAPDELRGLPVEALLPSHLARQHAEHRKAYFSQPRNRPMGLGMDLVGRRRDGSEFPLEISLSHVRAKGSLLAVAFVNDITERKRAENEKAKLEHRLEHATKMEAIGRLAGGIAHDFNNLLTALSGFAEIAVEELPEGHPLHEGARETFKTCQRSVSLVRRLLAVSRRQVLQPEILDLNSKISDIEKMLRSILGEDIDFVVKLAPDLGFVRADQSQIEQVLLNLIVNARDAMPTGGRLSIQTANVDVDETFRAQHPGTAVGCYVVVTVADTGHGMTSETLEHIFEPFFTTKEKGKGTGLGLASVYGIVNQSGGHITVYSKPDRGTTFRLYLPRVSRAGAPEGLMSATTPPPAGSETILVVEDEATVRLVAVTTLRKAGYHVLEASDASEAMKVADRHSGSIHLILTDVLMPGVNGPALVKRISETRGETKALYMSGHADDALLHHGVLEGIFTFLEKPFSRAVLTKRVREVLDHA